MHFSIVARIEAPSMMLGFEASTLSTKRSSSTGNFEDQEYVLEPFINQYLGYDEFEKLLSEQANNFEIIQLQSFFNKYKKSDFTSVSYYANQIEFPSDPKTIFFKSNEYPHLPEKNSIVRTEKISYSSRHPELAGADWIAHTAVISYVEALRGGTYIFKKELNLKAIPNNILSAIIYFLVDDNLLSLQINDTIINENFYDYNLPDSPPHSIDISKYLVPKEDNVLIFTIYNKNVEYEPHLQGNPNNNPYEFIYNIVLSFDIVETTPDKKS